MQKYILKKLLYMIIVFFGITVITFVLGIFSPGDPAELALSQGGGYIPTEEQIQLMRENMGLNAPYYIQYFQWLKKFLLLDFGVSNISSRPILDLFKEKLPLTLQLAAYTLVIRIVFGLGLGILAAANYRSLIDETIKVVLNIFLSLPQFWIGLLLILLFNEKLKLLPSSGVGSIEHMIMPAVTLSLIAMANIARFTRSVFLQELGKSYYRYGIVRGISKYRMIFSHIFKNTLVSILPMLGNHIGGILGASAVVEVIFAIPGIGSFAIESIFLKDFPVVQAYVIFTGGIFLLVYNLVDIFSQLLNPRLKTAVSDDAKI